MPRTAARKPPRNLAAYWKMEAANVLLVPGLALLLGWPRSPAGWVAMVFAILAAASLLVVGALYWRGVDRRLKGLGRRSLHKALAVADRAEKPALAATGLAIAASGAPCTLAKRTLPASTNLLPTDW